jgi:Protein of unknown function (DUF1207)
MRVPAVARWTILAVLAAPELARAGAQTPGPGSAGGALFRPLLADPKEPQFFAAYLWERSPRLAPRLGSVGFGQTIGVADAGAWQVGIAAAVFSQFNLARPTADLMNTDYRVGLPVTYRHAGLTTRLQLYHQSSHLGDEYMVHANAQRVDLTFEAAELLVSQQLAAWRMYGGGEYVFTHSPADLKPGVLHGGVEYRQPRVLVHLGRLATGRVVAALDAKALQDRGWDVGWSAITGLELGDPLASGAGGWRWSLLLRAYTGPAPYGEFFRDRVASLGFGLGLAL